MAWGEGHDEGNILRDLDEINTEVKNIGYRQAMNSSNSYRHSNAGFGGGALLLFLILAFPGVIIAYFLGVGNGDDIFSIIVNLCMGIYGLILALFLWSLNNPLTILFIAFPMILFTGLILMACFSLVKIWLDDFTRPFKRPRR